MYWFEGATSEHPPKIEITDRGLLLADAVFDTALAYRGKVAFARRHEERLSAWLATAGIEASSSAVAEPYAALADQDHAVSIRVTVTRGSGPRGISPPAATSPRIFASEAPLPNSFVSAPLRLATSNILRNSTSISSTSKTADYVDAIQAMRAAVAKGYDDAFFLNERGNVTCSTVANIFVAHGGELFTPPVSDGVVPGVIRAVLLELFGAREKSLTVYDLQLSDGVLLTNSLRLVCPVISLDGVGLPSGSAFRRAQEFLFQAVYEHCGLELFNSDHVYRLSGGLR